MDPAGSNLMLLTRRIHRAVHTLPFKANASKLILPDEARKRINGTDLQYFVKFNRTIAQWRNLYQPFGGAAKGAVV